MRIQQLQIYSIQDMKTNKECILHHNAFILPDGKFYLAKGYTGCNPSQQLESSAKKIAKETISSHAWEDFENYPKEKDGKLLPHFQQLRTILVHFYGYGLFARQEYRESYQGERQYFDYSILPNPQFYGKEATANQIETLRLLFELNDDGTFHPNPFMKTTESHIQKILEHKNDYTGWHH